jgi:cardiolipin synthase
MKKHMRAHVVRIPIVAFVAMLLVITLLSIFLWSTWRGPRDMTLLVKDTGELQTLMPSIVGLTQSSLEAGNSVRVLQNGDGFFPLVLAEIATAQHSIHVESYIWEEGAICNQVAAALAQKARQGVEVRVLVDASGGRKLHGDLQKLLEDAGVKVAFFHPIRFSNLGRINNRDHRKMVVIDGRIAYTGGYGFSKSWTGHAQDKEHYRDTGLRLQGPVVNRMQGAFCENWSEETGEIIAGDEYFPREPVAGATSAHVAYTSPSGGRSAVEVLYYMAIKSARREIIIQNPYMLPDKAAIKALTEAVKRGVDVKIMVPATTSTDSPIVQHASHHHFGTLLKGGVKIWEYKKTLLHQKLIVVDGVWSAVGSTNFDDRSFRLNDEITVGVIDPMIAQQLRAAFADDMRFAEQRHFEEWKNRSLWHKLEDGVAYLGNDQL